MVKEIGIILLAVGCIFLIIPLIWVFIGSPLSFVLPLVLLAFVLAYAAIDIKKLYKNREYDLAHYSIVSLILAILFSFLILYLIFPYVTPKLLV